MAEEKIENDEIQSLNSQDIDADAVKPEELEDASGAGFCFVHVWE